MHKGQVIIDSQRCKGCRLCVQTCPHGVLELGKPINAKGFHAVTAVAPEKCTGCTLCATMCPDVVITVERA